jgi:uncharacterized membrane protein YdbT with pleckstrin-like domain
MNCQACGAELLAEAVFCHRCGERIVRVAEKPAEVAQAPGQEEGLWQDTYSSRALIPAGLGLGLLSIVLLIPVVAAPAARRWELLGLWLAVMLTLWIYYAAVAIHRRWGSRYRLTSQRLFRESGMFLRSTDCIHLADVDSIRVVQSLPQRLLGVGTVFILTHDISHPKLVLRGIADIDRVFALLNKARREQQSLPNGRPGA